MMLMYGFSHAVTKRRVISARGWSKLECTEATHRSNPAKKSSSQSTDPSGAMLSSVPCSSSSGASRARTWSRWASIFSSVIRWKNRFGAWSVIA